MDATTAMTNTAQATSATLSMLRGGFHRVLRAAIASVALVITTLS